MPGKRKANEMHSAEPQEKLSKKAKLKLARERAAQFAQRDKAKIESRRGRNAGAGSPKVNAQNKLSKNNHEEMHGKKMTDAAVAKKSPKKKSTLTERRKIALKNAKEYAARDLAGLTSKNKVARAVQASPKDEQEENVQGKLQAEAKNQESFISPTTSESKMTHIPGGSFLAPPQQAVKIGSSPVEVASSAVHPSRLAAALPNNQNFGAAIDPNQVAAYERMRQMQYVIMQQQLATQQQTLMQQHAVASKQGLLIADQQRLQAETAARHEQSRISRMNVSIPSESVRRVEKRDAPLLQSETIVADGRIGDDNNFVEEMNEEDMPPPPPALMAQVSQQVLLNVQNENENLASPVSIRYERHNEGEQDQVIAGDNNEIPHPMPNAGNDDHLQATKPKTRWLQKISSVIVVGVALLYTIIVIPTPSTEESLSPGVVVPEQHFCYLNSDSEKEEGCLNDSDGSECPKGGVCEGGALMACNNIFQDVSDRGDKCVLGEDYLEMKAALMNQLLSHASQICDQSSKPSFKYAMLQKEQPSVLEDESGDLVEALINEGFVVHEGDGLRIGLPEGFKVKLPIYCILGNIGQLVLQEVGLLILGILRITSSNLVGFVSTYPKLSIVISVLLFCFSAYRRYRSAKKKRQEDISRTRTITYKTLEESCGVEHCAIHIRDEIAMALYPNSKNLRLELQKSVWPKVVDDVKRDTRVRKFQTFNKDGKTRDMWQWVAATKTPSQS